MSYVIIKFLSGRELRLQTDDEEVIAVTFDGRNISNEQDQVALRNLRNVIDELLLEAEGGAMDDNTDISKLLEMPLATLGLSERPLQSLRRGHILTIGDLVKRSENDLLGLTNLGQKSLDEIKSRLINHGIELSKTDLFTH